MIEFFAQAVDIGQMADKVFHRELSEYYGVVSKVFNWFGRHGVAFLINTAVAITILVLAWVIIHYIRKSVDKALSGKDFHNKLRYQMMLSLITGVWWLAVALLVCKCYNINVLPAMAGLGVAGIIVGFAFQETLSSLAAGAMLCFSEPFEIGDEVSIAGYDGYVQWFGYTSTRVRTYDNRVVTIPNKSVWGAPLVNYTRMPIRRCDRTVGISYSADIEKARRVAKEALLAMPGILHDPAPQIWATALQDSSVQITVWPWCKTEDYWNVWENSYPVIKAAFDKNGIEIPFNQMDVHIKEGA